ncbi:MAG TPA: hypothetical protein V6D19_21675 [Stenomitos sp.]
MQSLAEGWQDIFLPSEHKAKSYTTLFRVLETQMRQQTLGESTIRQDVNSSDNSPVQQSKLAVVTQNPRTGKGEAG